MKIKVSYNGKWPCACMGRLVIKQDDQVIYDKEYCCKSTGRCSFDKHWNAEVEDGELLWEDAKNFSKEIQDAVEIELSKVRVCCGGCI